MLCYVLLYTRLFFLVVFSVKVAKTAVDLHMQQSPQRSTFPKLQLPPKDKWAAASKAKVAAMAAKCANGKCATAGSWPKPAECDRYISHGGGPAALSSEAVLSWMRNRSLLEYMYPVIEPGDAHVGWQAVTAGCEASTGCWCFHVAGSMVKARNPKGLKRCAPKDRLLDCSDPVQGFLPKARRNCSCFAQALASTTANSITHHIASSTSSTPCATTSATTQAPRGPPCLFGDMRPAKLLAIIAACRAAGVTHILEQGRYGGLSAFVYSLHGFQATPH